MLGLRYTADVRTLLFETIFFSLLYVHWQHVTLFTWQSFAMLGLSMLFAFFGAVAVHNTVHVPMWPNKGFGALLNAAFFCVLTLTIGHPVSSYVPGHNYSHHKYMETRKDVMRTCQMRYSWNLLNLLLFVPAIFFQTMRNDSKYFMAQRAKGRPIWNQFVLECAVLYSCSAYMLYWDWQRFLFTVFIPWSFGKYCIVSLNMLQHDGCDAEHRYNFARNFVGDNLNFWCYNNGYHTVHHMFPGKHWSLLKEEHERIVAPHAHPNLNRESMLGYMFEAYIYPGKRVWYDGSEYKLPADYNQPQIDWAYDADKPHDG